MCWKQNAFNPKLTSSPSGQKEGHLEGPWGTFLLQLRKLSHQLARNGQLSSPALGHCVSVHGGCSCLTKGSCGRAGKSRQDKKRKRFFFLFLQPGSDKNHREQNIQPYTCQQNDVSNAQSS